LVVGYPSYDPVRLAWQFAALIVLAFIVGYVLHWFRRSFREGAPTEPPQQITIPGNRIKAYDVVERLFHWTDFVVLGMMVLTGVSIFFPGFLYPLLSAFALTNRDAMIMAHVTFVWALLTLIIIHIVWDMIVARGWWNIWLGRRDMVDMIKRAKNFMGISKSYPREGKYDFFMKSFHWGITVCLVGLGLTGIYFMNPLPTVVPMPNLAYGTEQLLRLIHDLFAFLAVGLIIGHIYFAIIPENWPILIGMLTGTVSKEYYLQKIDAERWPLTKPIKTKTAANQK
jgi:formate dehydrogenase subunit gamma